MAATVPKRLQEVTYEEAAQAYLRRLPPEHFMEATAQATQRKITLESLDLVKARRPDVHVFNELLLQFPRQPQRAGKRVLEQVVPDNMVVICDQPLRADSSYNVPLEPALPFWTLEYVSKSNKRKDYEDSYNKYERLKVPYYLIFYPDDQELTLYRHNGKRYVSVKPKEGRYEIPQLDLAVGLLDGWVRFWHEGALLPLPADMLRALDDALRRANEESRRADEEARRTEEEKRRADVERQRADAEKQRAGEEKSRADDLKQRLEDAERELARYRGRQ